MLQLSDVEKKKSYITSIFYSIEDHIYDAPPSLLIESTDDPSNSGVPASPLQFQTQQHAPPPNPQHASFTPAPAQPSSSQHPPSISIDDILRLERKIDDLTVMVHTIVQYLHMEVHSSFIDIYGNYKYNIYLLTIISFYFCILKDQLAQNYDHTEREQSPSQHEQPATSPFSRSEQPP